MSDRSHPDAAVLAVTPGESTRTVRVEETWAGYGVRRARWPQLRDDDES